MPCKICTAHNQRWKRAEDIAGHSAPTRRHKLGHRSIPLSGDQLPVRGVNVLPLYQASSRKRKQTLFTPGDILLVRPLPSEVDL